MADNSKIEWTDATWNPVTGCSVVSPGCTNCYAMRLAGTRLQHHPSRAGLTQESKAGPVWTGEVRLNEEWLTQPMRWKRPRMIFVCAHGDLFHESVPDKWIDRVFAVMALCPQHTFQVLTKRSKRMLEYAGSYPGNRIRAVMHAIMHQSVVGVMWPLPNVWLGVSVEDQARANDRIPDLLSAPAALRFVSAEPLLEAVDLTSIDIDGEHELNAINPMSSREMWENHWLPAMTGVSLEDAITGYIDNGGVYPPTDERGPRLDWVIVGGESGPGARPMHPDWARALRDQCAGAGVPFFFKQWGRWFPNFDCDKDDPGRRRNYAGIRRRSQVIINLAGGDNLIGERVFVAENVDKYHKYFRRLDGIEHSAIPDARHDPA